MHIVGADASGNVWVTWLQFAGGLEATVGARRYVPGVGFEAPLDAGYGYELALAVSDTGHAVSASLRTIYSQSPVGFFNSAWASVYQP